VQDNLRFVYNILHYIDFAVSASQKITYYLFFFECGRLLSFSFDRIQKAAHTGG